MKKLMICTSVVLLSVLASSGCASTGESANRDSVTQHVGVYPPAPAGIARPKVGVPPFMIDGEAATGAKLDGLAADQLTSLAIMSGRFTLIERAQLEQLLREQGLEGIVRSDQMASMGEVAGVDYLLFGRVTNFRVRVDESSRGLGLGRVPIPGAGNIGAVDYKKKSKKITVDCGVDLRLVNPTTGEIAAAHFGEFQKVDYAEAFGVDILGASAQADAELQLDDDNKGKILRLALDESLRKMLPQVDRALIARSSTSGSGGATPTAQPEGQAKFCSQCGKALPGEGRFCGSCGAEIKK